MLTLSPDHPLIAMPPQILLIDDDESLARLLKAYLGRQGYEVTWAPRPSVGLAKMADGPDLVLLDVMMPEQDGFSVCSQLRQAGYQTPVIMLTARGNPADRVQGLRGGADDYVPKPFEPLELLARIEAVLRRAPKPDAAPEPQCRLDADHKVLHLGDRQVPLTLSEFRLLEAMTARPGKLFNRDQLLDLMDIAGALDASDRAVDVHVSRLRAKLEVDPRQPKHLITVRGLGYRFEW